MMNGTMTGVSRMILSDRQVCGTTRKLWTAISSATGSAIRLVPRATGRLAGCREVYDP